MTFSDSRIVKALQKDWMPVWESVSPVREVTFDLGEGREVRGTVGGEIAIYFCDEQGQVFDILPALQSPAATLKAIERAHAFFKETSGKIDSKSVAAFHRNRLRDHLEMIFQKHPERFPNPKLTLKDRKTKEPPTKNTAGAQQGIEALPAKKVYPETAKNEASRQAAIKTALDAATRDMRLMAFSKVAAPTVSEGTITVVEPGGRGYYSWQVGQAFCGIVPSWESMINRVKYPKEEWPLREVPRRPNPNGPLVKRMLPVHPLAIGVWNADLKQPSQWRRLLFEGILHQPLGGGKFKYDSESLKALSIIED